MFVVDGVAEIVRFVELIQGQRHRALQLGLHGIEDRVELGRGENKACAREKGRGRADSHWTTPAVRGEGSSGSRSCEASFFSISISEISMAGETAETGTLPDSAPQ